MHQATARRPLLPIGVPMSRPRKVSMMGWNAGAKPYDGTLEIRYRPDGSVAGT